MAAMAVAFGTSASAQQSQHVTIFPGCGYKQVPTAPRSTADTAAHYSVDPLGRGAPEIVIVGQPLQPSYALHISLACITIWCCGGLFGIVAYVVVICAQRSQSQAAARNLGRLSLGISIVGIVVWLACLGLIVYLTLNKF